jgi:uncharacterized protein (UPF0297 family)
MKGITLCIMTGLMICLIQSCTSNNIYINREQDKREGKIFLDKLYANINNKNYNAIDGMVGDSLKHLAGPSAISDMVKFINKKVGNYKSYKIDDSYFRCVTGDNSEISFNYKLKVVYEKGIIDEIVGFKKNDGSAIKINSYHANSDLLIH